MEKTNTSARLESLDVLRGFDMFWIMGGSQLIVALSVVAGGCGVLDWTAGQMEHEAWHGFRFMDMVFPLFLFVAGISFPFSHAKRVAAGTGRSADAYRHVIKRGLTLIVLGCVYNGLLQLDFANMRYASVLGRIGIAWMFAALIYMNAGKIFRVVWCVGILVAYWLIIRFIPAPDAAFGVDVFSMEGNIASYIDRVIMPGRLYLGVHDPEGLASSIPAIATALLGMFTGDLVRSARFGMQQKLLLMLAAGVALLSLGLLWNEVFPINKNLWTSSFVCYVGGLSLLLFAIFYWIIDIRKWRSWTLFFKVIGLNSIAIYMAQAIVNFGYTSDYIFGGFARLFPEEWTVLVLAAAYIAICWLFLWFLYRNKMFLKV